MYLLPFLFKTGVSILAYQSLSALLSKSGTDNAKKQRRISPQPQPLHEQEEKESKTMAYEIIGAEELEGLIAGLGDDDEDFGAVGSDEDLLNALSVSGSGTTEIIGAAEKRGAKKALAALKARKGGAVVDRGVSKRRRMPIGFAPATILAGSSGIIPGSPQNIFRVERLVIPSSIAFDCGVTDLKVGNQSQFAQSSEVPAVIFSEVAINTHVEFDTAEVGNQISIGVHNTDASNSMAFTAAAIGTVAK